MKLFKSILSLCLVLVTTLLVSCGGPSATTPPPTYTPEKIAVVEKLLPPIESARESMSELETLIDQENWTDTKSFIHGPLGELRQQMSYLSRQLLPTDQQEATTAAKELFIHLELLDAAAFDQRPDLAQLQYNKAVKDFDTFLNTLPRA